MQAMPVPDLTSDPPPVSVTPPSIGASTDPAGLPSGSTVGEVDSTVEAGVNAEEDRASETANETYWENRWYLTHLSNDQMSTELNNYVEKGCPGKPLPFPDHFDLPRSRFDFIAFRYDVTSISRSFSCVCFTLVSSR